MKTQAVILAGGLGTRLLPMTEAIPKPMIEVSGEPYLEHQLKFLREQGITEIVLLTGYLGEQIEAYFDKGERLRMSIRYSRERNPLGTGGAIRKAWNLLAESFLLIYGDSFLPIQYGDVMDRLEASGAPGVVVTYDNQFADTSVKNNIALDGGDFVSKYDKTGSSPDLLYVEAGVSAFRREILRDAPEGVFSLEQDIFPALIKGHELAGFRTTQRFYDIGTPDRLTAIESFFRNDYHSNTAAH